MESTDKLLDAGVAKRDGDAVLLQALDMTITRWLEAHPQYLGPMRLPNAAGAKKIPGCSGVRLTLR